MADIAILLNPTAGRGRALREKERLEAMLKRYRINHDAIDISDNEMHLRHLTIERARDHHTIVAAGGDGTSNIVINELMKHEYKNRFAIIGLGSSNDITREFDVDSLEKACAALKSRETRQVDLGFVTADGSAPFYFLGTASLALGTTVNRYVEDFAIKHPLLSRSEKINFIVGLLGIYHSYASKEVPIPLRLKYGDAAFTDIFSLVVFNNAGLYANGRRLSPDASPYDGLLDCCCITSESFSRFLEVYLSYFKGQHTTQEDVKIIRASEFNILSAKEVKIQADGEIIGDYKAVTISVKPKALSVIVNPKYAEN